MKGLFIVLAFVSLSVSVNAALTDPGRVLAIEAASKQAAKAIKAQEKAQLLMTTGHVWIKEEVEATTEFHKQFNNYLDSFHVALSVAAEIYGIYYEVTQTSKCVKNLNAVVAASPTNAIAVAFDARRGDVYTKLIVNTLDLLKDIRKVCVESSKMTEKERMTLVSNIRPKLKKINKSLRQLTLFIKYTSFADIWNQLVHRANMLDPTKRHDIITRCRGEWWNNAKSVVVH